MRLAAALLAAHAAACAHAPPPGAPFAFPDAFDANQLVEIATADGTREVVASLRRRGGDFEVTLFDPVFTVPLLSASTRGGDVRVDGSAPGLPEDAAPQLLALLQDLYGRTFRAAGADRLEARSRRFAYALVGVRARDGCPFPDSVEVSRRGRADLHLRVVTIDVSCVSPSSARR